AGHARQSESSLRDSISLFPAINRWAIFASPLTGLNNLSCEPRPCPCCRLWRRRSGQRLALIVALFVGTLARRALLGHLLQQERRMTLRARLGHGLVPIDHVARRI